MNMQIRPETPEPEAYQVGAYNRIAATMDAHLYRWREIHRHTYNAVLRLCNGRAWHRTHAPEVAQKIASMMLLASYSTARVQAAMGDLRAWGMIRTTDDLKNRMGARYTVAGIDYTPPANFDYLSARPDFVTKEIGTRKRPRIMSATGTRATFRSSHQPPADDTPDHHTNPGATLTRASSTKTNPLPPSTKSKSRSKSQRKNDRKNDKSRKRLGGGNLDQLRKVWAKSHEIAKSRLTPRTIQRAWKRAKKEHPELSNAEIFTRLVQLAKLNWAELKAEHPILLAAAGDWDELLAPRPGTRGYWRTRRPAPALTPLSAEVIEAGRKKVGYGKPEITPVRTIKLHPEPTEAERMAERDQSRHNAELIEEARRRGGNSAAAAMIDQLMAAA